MITISIDVNKLDKNLFKPGKKGQLYASFSLQDKPNEYGDDGYVAQSVSKEERLAGKKGPIVGNWKNWQHQEPPPRKDNPPF